MGDQMVGKIGVTTSLLLLLFCESLCTRAPNIVFMLIDDLGWNDVSFHGSMQIPTPNIDTLAYSGIILNKYYVQPICTPSRGSLMTGKYPIQIGLQHNVIFASEPWGLSPTETILPQYLKGLGYATHGVGKWHLGYFQSDYLPTNRGFDSFLGYWNGKEDFFTHLEEDSGFNGVDFHDGTENVWNYTGYYGTEAFTHRAKSIIENHNSSKPLFLYIAHQAVHAGNGYSPLQAPSEYIDKFSHINDKERRIFAGMVSALDKSVGEIFTALQAAGMLENTIIVFTTDNGGAVKGIDQSTGSNWPLRGCKYNMWEGGIRGTAFIWSRLLSHQKGSIFNHLMHISDWAPTLYAAAGGDLKQLGEIDGHNIWHPLYQNSPSPRDHILYNIDPVWKVESIRKGRYKLLKGSVFDGNFDGWFDKEGNKEIKSPFDSNQLRIQNEVYQRELAESEIARFFAKKAGGCPFEYCENSSEEDTNCPDVNAIEADWSACQAEGHKSPHFLASPIVVDCGPKPKDASTNCQPLNETCLFDIESDPCEYRNLASSLPLVVQELDSLLDKYRAEAVPIRNVPADEGANPKYHGYAWIPWQDKKS